LEGRDGLLSCALGHACQEGVVGMQTDEADA
jgi:hypothetical protein